MKYTLQQCYEALGSNFPFVVYWNNPKHPDQVGLYTIISRHSNTRNEYTWKHLPFHDLGYVDRFHSELAEELNFDYKKPEYNKDFENLLKDS